MATTNFDTWIHGLTEKTTPVNTDEIFVLDSAASFATKKITLTDLQTVIIAGTTLVSGVFSPISANFRLVLNGSGTVTLDAKDNSGNITTGLIVYTSTGQVNRIEYPFIGDGAVAVRATLTNTATAKVI